MNVEINSLISIFYLGFISVGCYKDTSNRAIQIIEGTDSILDGSYSFRSNPIAKCAVAAMRAAYILFAVQDGGQCAASATAPQTFDKYGTSTACKADGEGGPLANHVYLIKGETIKLINKKLRFVELEQYSIDPPYLCIVFIPILFCPIQYCFQQLFFLVFDHGAS